MKAVVPAGGKGSRLLEAKGLLNKHALPVYDRPMIEHVVRTLVDGGADEILIMLNSRYPETILEILEDGRHLGCKIYYTYVKEVDGPGRELGVAEDFVKNQDFILMLGDSLYLHPLKFEGVRAPHIWTMPLNGLDDPSKYGQVTTQDDKVLELREKPLVKFSNIIQTATWLFPPDVFEKARILCKERSGEIHIGMMSEMYVREGIMTHTELPPGSYIDLGTPDSLLKGANMLANRAHRH